MTAEQVDLWLKIITSIVSLAAFLIAVVANRRKDIDRQFKDIDRQFKAGSDRMDRHELRIQGIEQSVQAMPDKDEMHALQLELVKQTGALGEMRAIMEGNAKIMERLETIVSRHEDHLLSKD